MAAPFFAAIYAGLDEHDPAFELLERGYAQRHGAMAILRLPPWSSLQSDPRYGELLKRLGQGG